MQDTDTTGKVVEVETQSLSNPVVGTTNNHKDLSDPKRLTIVSKRYTHVSSKLTLRRARIKALREEIRKGFIWEAITGEKKRGPQKTKVRLSGFSIAERRREVCQLETEVAAISIEMRKLREEYRQLDKAAKESSRLQLKVTKQVDLAERSPEKFDDRVKETFLVASKNGSRELVVSLRDKVNQSPAEIKAIVNELLMKYNPVLFRVIKLVPKLRDRILSNHLVLIPDFK